jgi:hypothetical protein
MRSGKINDATTYYERKYFYKDINDDTKLKKPELSEIEKLKIKEMKNLSLIESKLFD